MHVALVNTNRIQPPGVHGAFQFLLATAMHEAGKMGRKVREVVREILREEGLV